MTSVPSPGTGFGVGVVDGSDLNSLVVDPIRFLLKRPMARLRQTVTQSLATSVATAITFTTSDVDQDYLTATNAGHSNSVNTSRYTANFAGWYLCSGGVSWAVSGTGSRGAYWYVNGTVGNGVEVMIPATATLFNGTPARAELIYLNVGDYVELFGFQSSGGNLSTAVAATGPASVANIVWWSN